MQNAKNITSPLNEFKNSQNLIICTRKTRYTCQDTFIKLHGNATNTLYHYIF